jgi:periplasmic divalent cation tolerance protein
MTELTPASIVSVYAVFADAQEASRIGRSMVEEKLAACVNVLGECQSAYRWQGKVEVTTEVAAIFKARADKAQALMARIAELHSYDVPAIAIWPIDNAWPAYVEWVETEG